ncbi:hypothetical protein [Rubritalea tangerina]|uniref:Uncharacterized protein n=1 Tax=Rubritalea tangerina TaxID=430798 RepID=A0ABW4ZCG6_9BACT
MMKTFLLFSLTLLCLPVLQAEPDAKRETLSTHKTLATYQGSKFRPCRHLTTLCPDQCSHAGTVAQFKVNQYLNYKKLGKYGDPKATTFHTMLEDQLGNSKLSKQTLNTIKALKLGDQVELSWIHEYVTQNNASYPVRTITELKPLPESSKNKPSSN